MSHIQVKDKKFVPYLTAAQIDEQVKRLGKELNADYAGKRPLFIAILNGSFMFASDLFKELDCEPEICFIKCCPEPTKSSKKKILEYFELSISAIASLNPKFKLSQTK